MTDRKIRYAVVGLGHIALAPIRNVARPDVAQVIEMPGVRKPPTVNTTSPSGD